jgi:hypothetical protein
MKRYLLLMPVILATTAAIADAQAIAPSSRGDAQAQAAALLSGPHTSGGVKADEVRSRSPSHTSTTADAQAQAAALLSGRRTGNQVNALSSVVEPSGARVSADAHAQAAALLRGSRASTQSQVRAERTDGGARAIGKAF